MKLEHELLNNLRMTTMLLEEARLFKGYGAPGPLSEPATERVIRDAKNLINHIDRRGKDNE